MNGWRHRLAPALVAAALLTACGSHHAGAGLHVAGHLLRDDAGHRFVVKGVTVEAVPFYTDGGTSGPALGLLDTEFAARDDVFRAVAAHGANTVRIPVSAGVYAADPGAYLARLEATVAAARARGLRVIVAWWDSLGASGDLSSQYRGWLPMMGVVARALSSDPGVVFEPLNEPNGISWATWREVVTALVRAWRVDIGYRGPLVLDTIDYSWAFDPASADAVMSLDGRLDGKPNILIANHRYADANTCFCGAEAASWEDAVGRYVGTYPILGTEYGAFNHEGPPQLTWNAQFLQHLTRTAIPGGLNGAVLYVWHWLDANTLAEPGTAGLTPWGRIGASELLSRSFGPAGRTP